MMYKEAQLEGCLNWGWAKLVLLAFLLFGNVSSVDAQSLKDELTKNCPEQADTSRLSCIYKQWRSRRFDGQKVPLILSQIGIDESKTQDELHWLAKFIRCKVTSLIDANDSKRAVGLGRKNIRFCKQINEDYELTRTLLEVAEAFNEMGLCDSTIRYSKMAYAMSDSIDHKNGKARSANVQAICASYRGDFEESYKQYEEAYNWFIELNDSSSAFSVRRSMALIFQTQGDYERVIEIMEELLEVGKRWDDHRIIVTSYETLAICHTHLGRYEKGEEIMLKAVKMYREVNNKHGLSGCLGNLGFIYLNAGKFKQAEKVQLESVALRIEINDQEGLAAGYVNLAESVMKQDATGKDPAVRRKALEYCYQGIEIMKRIKLYDYLRYTYLITSDCYAALGETEKALEHYKLHVAYKDSIIDQGKTATLAELETKYNVKEKEHQVQMKTALLAQANAESRRKSFQRNASFAGIGLLVIIALMLWRGVVQKRKSNAVLHTKNEELEQAFDEISIQKAVIEDKNAEILDSIDYAKRLQEAILPPTKIIKQYMEESFVLYKPKSVVSGDFYWMYPMADKVLFAAVDCTGHGVPGAFVSIVGHTGLNRAVQEFGLTRPGEILNKLSELVEETFNREGSDQVKDGMDIALCAIDFDTRKLEYAGANNPLYVVNRDGEAPEGFDDLLNGNRIVELEGSKAKLFEVKADKQPIGLYADRKEFENVALQLRPGDSIYVFSDGFADQFGGPHGKKFKYKPFKEMLISIADKPASDQKQMLNDALEDWKGELEQIDDICIIGLRCS